MKRFVGMDCSVAVAARRLVFDCGGPCMPPVQRTLPLILALSIATATTLPVLAQDGSTQQHLHFLHTHRQVAQETHVARHGIVVVRISPPQSGVRLIEEVFQRVRSAPQIAMAKTLQKQQQVQDLMKNDTLQIRPPQKNGTVIAMAPAPSLNLMPPSEASAGAPAARERAKSARHAAGGGGSRFDFRPNAWKNETSLDAASADEELAAPPAPPVVETWLGSRQYPQQGESLKRAPVLWENSVADTYTPPATLPMPQTLQPTPVSGLRYNGASPSEFKPGYAPPPLGSQISRLAGLQAQLQQMQQAANAPMSANKVAAAAAPAAVQTTGYPGSQRYQHLAAANGAAVGGSVGTLYDKISKDSDIMDDFKAGAAMGKPSPRRSRVTAKKAAVATAPTGLDDGGSVTLEYGRRKEKIAMAEPGIALLPPNVVTGIPLVRLGISERQVSGALNTMGSTRQELVDKWTVLSWTRETNKTQTALQLYMRNGLVDAMRIFDPSLIARDFGVSLGDDLRRVKEKFGEPAFILPEPGPGAGQNYIYPISQVGFQLTRPEPGQQPRVVSVLIFNVK